MSNHRKRKAKREARGKVHLLCWETDDDIYAACGLSLSTAVRRTLDRAEVTCAHCRRRMSDRR